jgi:serine/threonine-protein kinase
MSAPRREDIAHPLASTMHADDAVSPARASLDAQLGLTPKTIVAERYRIDGVIARGGMGAVLRATDQRLDRPVALKVILPALSEDLEAVERLRREALSAARVQHPGIVAVLDVGTCPHPNGRGRLCYLVMELVEGESLAAMAARGPIAPDLVVEIGLQALDALAAAHEAGLVHRDLKPANVLVSTTRSGIRVRLADFGLVQLAGTAAHSRLTQSGVILGTPLYMAPEQARAEPCDARTDVYALGLVLWTCLTARLPSNADGFASAIVAVLTEELPRADAWSPGVPRALADVIATATRKDPRERPVSAPALAALLTTAREHAPSPSSAPSPLSALAPSSSALTPVAPAVSRAFWGVSGLALAGLSAAAVVIVIVTLAILSAVRQRSGEHAEAAHTWRPTPMPPAAQAPASPAEPAPELTPEPRASHVAHRARAPEPHSTAALTPSETPVSTPTPAPDLARGLPVADESLAARMEPECRVMLRCCREYSRGYADCDRVYTNITVAPEQRGTVCEAMAEDFRSRIRDDGRALEQCPP